MIIALDGASTHLSVALAEVDGSPIADDAWTSQQRQSAELLPRLLALLSRADRTAGEVTAVAVGTGPGSFTGLRVAVALGKGLAVGLDRPIVGVPSLAAWLEAEPDALAALARAGAREAYLLARDAAAPSIADRDELSALKGPVVAPAELAAAFGIADVRTPRAAAAIARQAAARLAEAPAGDDRSALEPIYVRASRGLRDAPAEGVKWL